MKFLLNLKCFICEVSCSVANGSAAVCFISIQLYLYSVCNKQHCLWALTPF